MGMGLGGRLMEALKRFFDLVDTLEYGLVSEGEEWQAVESECLVLFNILYQQTTKPVCIRQKNSDDLHIARKDEKLIIVKSNWTFPHAYVVGRREGVFEFREAHVIKLMWELMGHVIDDKTYYVDEIENTP